jgi:nucleotide-binding universal stress UspA family protein
VKIVVGYTPSPQGEAALDRAIVEARAHGTQLLVINTSHGDRYVDPSFAGADDLAAARRRLDDSGIAYELQQPVRGRDAAEELVDAAAADDVELLVIGLRHRTAVGKFLMGSTAQQIMLNAACPVLGVKP